jgi:hypothetical protein
VIVSPSTTTPIPAATLIRPRTAFSSASPAPNASAPRTWRSVSTTFTTSSGTIASQISWRPANSTSSPPTPANSPVTAPASAASTTSTSGTVRGPARRSGRSARRRSSTTASSASPSSNSIAVRPIGSGSYITLVKSRMSSLRPSQMTTRATTSATVTRAR